MPLPERYLRPILPVGYDEIGAAYGDPMPQPLAGMPGKLTWSGAWEQAFLVRVTDLPGYVGRKVAVNRIILPCLRLALTLVGERCPNYPIRTLGCWAVRYKRRDPPGRLSLHSYGIAVDVNERTNRCGVAGDMPDEFGCAFEDVGFIWGRRWSGPNRDDMHFQLARG